MLKKLIAAIVTSLVSVILWAQTPARRDWGEFAARSQLVALVEVMGKSPVVRGDELKEDARKLANGESAVKHPDNSLIGYLVTCKVLQTIKQAKSVNSKDVVNILLSPAEVIEGGAPFENKAKHLVFLVPIDPDTKKYANALILREALPLDKQPAFDPKEHFRTIKGGYTSKVTTANFNEIDRIIEMVKKPRPE